VLFLGAVLGAIIALGMIPSADLRPLNTVCMCYKTKGHCPCPFIWYLQQMSACFRKHLDGLAAFIEKRSRPWSGSFWV
jgi:hypothetical protein